ncbi:OmpH family outer membrane protein [Rubinisphaera italica]|uniref:Outer membrane protein (OmpH-like) n=1 Tax=Rubinisphaera italica TaxID=2527969 RepID=A0A5C5XQZ7_9PLAN|nr:OmpH family outer membrane protein [Rubinisphaera italica]TWT64495.1 Outer membrane protein (OmpH-like) [Rubinisphaera italica]
MIRVFNFLSLTLACGILAGCGGSEPAGQRVAIVDFEEVLKGTGLDKDISQVVQQSEAQIRGKLAEFQKQLEDQFAAKRKEFGETPTPEQEQELQAFFNELNAQNQRATNQTNQNLQQFQQTISQQIQEQIKGICLELAEEGKYDLIMAKSPFFLAYSDSIDLTAQVVERMNAKIAEADAEVTPEGSAIPGIPGMSQESGSPIAPPPTLTTPSMPEMPAVPAGTSTPKPAGTSTETPTTEAPAGPPASTTSPEPATTSSTPAPPAATSSESTPAPEATTD